MAMEDAPFEKRAEIPMDRGGQVATAADRHDLSDRGRNLEAAAAPNYAACMPLYRIEDGGVALLAPAAFADIEFHERRDLQPLLRDQIEILGDDLMVIAEELSWWEDSRRRIDLLALDKAGHLVVLELKRTQDGGHVDLQALRYAAMVSAMTFEDVVRVFAEHLDRTRPDEQVDARAKLEGFLESDEDPPEILQKVRLYLIAAGFGPEITTTVLWLNVVYGMDIRCIRLVPYQLGGEIVLDKQQLVPLPEAADYQVQLRRKVQERELTRTSNRDLSKFHIVIDGQERPEDNKRNTVLAMVTQLIERGASPQELGSLLGSKLRSIEGTGMDAEAVATQLTLDRPRWFLDHLFAADGRTWVLSKMWGRRTEETLDALVARFPQAGVGYRKASSD